MDYECKECQRICNDIIDRRHEMQIGGYLCNKCWYGEWTQEELKELEEITNKSEISNCGCSNGCYNCLDIEARSFK